jgi:transposase-like protein
MAPLSYRRHRFPAEIIQHAIWLYLRFILSYRDVEELLAERGLDISYETVRRWVLNFGPLIARKAAAGPRAEFAADSTSRRGRVAHPGRRSYRCGVDQVGGLN